MSTNPPKELIVTLKFSLGEAPDIAELRKMGMPLQEYATMALEEILSAPTLNDFEIEVKATIKNKE